MKWFAVLLASFFFPPAIAASSDPDPGSHRASVEMIDEREYLVPNQLETDILQFHLVGDMQCYAEEFCGEPRLERGVGYTKSYRLKDTGDGIGRFVMTKAPRHPSEYYSVRDDLGPDGKPIQRIYLETETTQWTTNQENRSYFDGNGFPTVEWGNSQTPSGMFRVQNPYQEIYSWCGAQPNRVTRLPDNNAGMYSLEFDFGKISLEEANAELGSLGPIDPRWLDLAKDLGKSPKILVKVGHYHKVDTSKPAPPIAVESDWGGREVYIYLSGVGIVGFRGQFHPNGDANAPFITGWEGILYQAVWEETPELSLAICEKL